MRAIVKYIVCDSRGAMWDNFFVKHELPKDKWALQRKKYIRIKERIIVKQGCDKR